MSRTDIAKTRKRIHIAIFLCIITVVLACFCLGFACVWDIAETAQEAVLAV